jgi:hypothetical protein
MCREGMRPLRLTRTPGIAWCQEKHDRRRTCPLTPAGSNLGALLRAGIGVRTRIGREVAPLLERGDLAPDSLMDRVLRARLETLDPDEGILLDGYPRTTRQAPGLAAMLVDCEHASGERHRSFQRRSGASAK